jgi:hypothetical protein
LPQLSDAGGSASVGEAGLEVSGSGEADNGGNLVTIHEPTTEAETATLAHSAAGGGLDQEADDIGSNSDYDEEPLRFRSLSEVYDDTTEVELASDSEVVPYLH